MPELNIVEGRAAEATINYAEKDHVDLIIISPHGRSGISRWTFGSVVERVLRHSIVPGLSVAPAACRINQSAKKAIL
jgi:nucleotide-binding universal stress UspA family protein